MKTFNNWELVRDSRVYEEDGYTVVRSSAWSPPGDHPVGCGVKIYTKDGRLVKIEGDEEHPVNQGRLCIRCLSLPEYVYHPDRIIYPMLRVGARGENKWKRISWDEAYDLIEKKTKETKEKYGPESILVMGGTGRQACMYYQPFAFGVFQTPNVCYPFSGCSCYGPRVSITSFCYGIGYPEIDYGGQFPDRQENPKFKLPEYVVLWGKAPLESNPDGLYGHAIVEMMKKGTKLIVIDPRVTWLASRAEQFLQIRPGSDTALGMAVLNVIINEDLYDHDFVEKWTYGFEQLKERVQEMPPEKAAELTWIPKEKIVQFARSYAKAEQASITWGLPTDTKPNGIQHAQCVLAIEAITGNIDKPGGLILGIQAYYTGLSGMRIPQWFFALPEELQKKTIGLEEFPAYFWGTMFVSADRTLDALETGKPYPLKMCYINSTNFMASTAAAVPNRWYEALKDPERMEFTFATDCFITPTISALADLVLPLATWAEMDGYVTTHYGMTNMCLSALKKAYQVGECKSEIEIMFELGKRLNPEGFYWETLEDMLDWCLEPGFSFRELQQKGWIQPDFEYFKYEKGMLRPDGELGFNTESGKIELYATKFVPWGEDPLPYYKETPYSPYSTPELAKEYPLILDTGHRDYASFHSEHRQMKTLREIKKEAYCEIHPDTAKRLGIVDGQMIVIENMFGKCKQRAKLTEGIDPRVVEADHGWWYPEQDIAEPNLGGVWQSNINLLIPHDNIGKLGFGAPFKNMICKVYPAEEEAKPIVPAR